MTMKHFWLGLLLIGALTGCASHHADPSWKPRPTVTVTVPATPETPVEQPVEGVVKYGETYRWGEMDLESTVAEPVVVYPKNIAGQRYKSFLQFTITMTNLSKYAWTDKVSPMLITPYSNRIYHVTDGDMGVLFSGDPPMEIAPGKSVTFKLVFGVMNPDNTVLDIEITPGFRNPITWS